MRIISGFRLDSKRVLNLRGFFGILALALASKVAFGVVVYDETSSGDFSGSGLSPTSIGTLAPGGNEVHGVTGKDSTGTRDIDYFSFTIPTGFQLSEVLLLEAAPGSTGFAGLQAGGQITLPPNATSPAGLLGWVHYKDTQIGTDLLDDIGSSVGATDFTPPLPAGTYSLWVQDGNPGPLPYRFNFVVTAVPDHGSTRNEFGLALLATASLFGLMRFRKAIPHLK